MQLHNLKPAKGSTHHTKRVGRGEGSGYGVTAGRGNKGQQQGSGYESKIGFEGGQMTLARRSPKRGFKNRNRVSYVVFNLSQLDYYAEKYGIKEFSVENLYINGLINRTDLVKVLGSGELKTAITVKVNAVSASAKAAVEAAGGTVELY
ncbi:MAG TPA: 50S ribosomal protein L15 [Edaphocola sp.]|nr:50S ribosomal protein L15 [Edaphocola sp.]